VFLVFPTLGALIAGLTYRPLFDRARATVATAAPSVEATA
jgi:hypothetical protein